ncbi:ArsA family ATPase [Ilumatobacter sp.]|uniref:ArsA family ATPase n=1 Tax=Ilumatobacter sp. TaxID=1967498 RepID=UPI003B5199FA
MSDVEQRHGGERDGSLVDVVRRCDLILTCGPGGVGKTTTAAALGVAAARAGRRTVVVTVDPARRLADALGLAQGAAADQPHQVPEVTRRSTDGELWALMLDAEKTFDRLVRSQSANRAQAEAVLNNPVYQAISGSLSGAQEYMAIERLHELHVSGEWDLVIVDTPPSRHAIDLLEAPDRLVGFLGHPIYRALTVGQRTFAKVTDAASSMFLWAVKRLAGPQIVEDTVEFFRSLANIEGGLRRRAKEVSKLLRADSTAFVVVSSPRAEAVGEAGHLLDAVGEKGFPLGGLVVNLIHPLPVALSDDDEGLLADLDDGPLLDHLAWHRELSTLALAERREIEALEALAADAPVVELPLLDVDVHDVEGLVGLASRLVERADPPGSS